MNDDSSPTYELAHVQALVRLGRYRVTASARKRAQALGFGEAELVACILALTMLDFHKTMESESAPGLWQDVYRPLYAGLRLYVKVQVQGWSTAVVISFKER